MHRFRLVEKQIIAKRDYPCEHDSFWVHSGTDPIVHLIKEKYE